MSRAAFRRFPPLAGYLALAAVLPLLAADDEAPKGRQYALLVGVKDYDKEQLRGPKYGENDAADLATVLKDGGYEVTLLTQTEAAARKDDGLRPTEENTRKQLKAVLDGRKPGDVVLVAFSGRGFQSKGDRDSYFCPQDADPGDAKTWISLSDVYKRLEVGGPGLNVLLAAADRVAPNRQCGEVDLETVTRPASPRNSVAALFACSAGERSLESDKLKHSLFFHYVIQGLKGEAANKKGEVTPVRLASYVKDQVPDAAREAGGGRQTPELVGNLAGSIPLLTKGTEQEK